MKRRNFVALAGSGILAASCKTGAAVGPANEPNLIRPSALKEGDVVGLVTPGFPTAEEDFQRAIEQIKNWGFVPKLADNVNRQFGYLAGTDRARARDLMDMFRDQEVKAIWCIRGGYGCTRILPMLDFNVIKQNPKILIGYSDITALHLAIYQQTGLVTFHGPVATSEFNDYTLTQSLPLLMGQWKENQSIGLSDSNIEKGKENSTYQYQVLKSGRATGVLTGGNLSLVSAMAGTPYLPSFANKLVFLEDIGERPYRIDRMLVQLLQSTDIEKAAGFILGIFADCEPSASGRDFSVRQLLEQHLVPLKTPVVYGFSFGHIDDQCTLPLGIEASMDTAKKEIRLLSNPVQ